MRKNYSQEQQKEIIKMYSSGVTVTELSNRYGIARSTIYSWLNDGKNKKLDWQPFFGQIYTEHKTSFITPGLSPFSLGL